MASFLRVCVFTTWEGISTRIPQLKANTVFNILKELLSCVVEKHQPIKDGTQGNTNVHVAHVLWNVDVFRDFSDFKFLMEPRCS